MKKIGNYQIPFNKAGDQLAYPTRDCMWNDNYEFDDTLELVDWDRGRSSVTFIMKRQSNGQKVCVFVVDFYNMSFRMNNGTVTGRFVFTKKGANYGCKLIS